MYVLGKDWFYATKKRTCTENVFSAKHISLSVVACSITTRNVRGWSYAYPVYTLAPIHRVEGLPSNNRLRRRRRVPVVFHLINSSIFAKNPLNRMNVRVS